MIDFKTHIRLFEDANRKNNTNTYFESIDPLERLSLNRDIEQTYPIQDSSYVSDYIKENFSVTSTVEDAVLGQFIMLEQIVTGKEKFLKDYERDIAFAKLILRPKHHDVFDNENPEDEIKNEEMIMASPVQDIYSAINTYLNNRDFVLFKQFAGVFYEIPDEDEEEEEEKQETDTSKLTDALFRQQWYWYTIVRMLAQEDITRYEEIYMLKMSVVLPEMSYLSQRDKIDNAKMKAEQATNKL
mgnify:CR=1 FL=1